ncbi:hypothetical protein IFM89_039550 [Coptis chinensis]|uniref:NAC domain-containing protein n=1 Tax=Coptis chinensis TaxID=261450 RepID=A0A835LCA4_9MAGN|nr:hypothetical protein IFM89_039550 [Coptis chinensis]
MGFNQFRDKYIVDRRTLTGYWMRYHYRFTDQSELSSHKKFLHDESNCTVEVEAKLCICFDFDYGSKSSKMRAPNGMKSGWVMHEFRLENLHMPPKCSYGCTVCRLHFDGINGAESVISPERACAAARITNGGKQFDYGCYALELVSNWCITGQLPTEADLECMNENAKRYSEQVPGHKRQLFSERFPHVHPAAVDPVEKMLTFGSILIMVVKAVTQEMSSTCVASVPARHFEAVCSTPLSSDSEQHALSWEQIKELI